MTGPASAAGVELAARIVTLPTRSDCEVRTAVEQALANNRVLRLSYTDAADEATASWNRPDCSPPTAAGTSSPGAAHAGPAGVSGWTGSQQRLRPVNRHSRIT